MDASLPLGRNKKQNHSLMSCVLHGMLRALLLMLLLLLGAAMFAFRSEDPATRILPLSYAVALLTFLMGGLFAGKRRARQGLLCGALTGVGMLLVFLVGYLALLGEGDADLGHLLLSYLLLLALSLIGGVIGASLKLGGARRVRRPKRH